MTLDEAIRHCEEVAEEKECIAHSLTKDGWQEHFNNLTQEKEAEYKNVREEMANGCLECAKEHRQLAEWLRELKSYKDFEDKGYVMCRFEVAQDDRHRTTKMVLDFSTKELFDNIVEVNTDDT